MAASFTGPIKNKEKTGSREWFSGMDISNNPDIVVYFNDFLTAQDYAATDWTITTVEAGAGDATEALAADELNGALLITNDAADDDSDSLQLTQETFKIQSGKKLWFETKLKISDATQSDLLVGLNIRDTTPLASSDGIVFLKSDGSTAMSFKTYKDTTATTTSSVYTMTTSYVTLGFYWDGVSTVKAFVNRALVATHTTNICDDENLALTLHIQNGEAAAKTCTVDYFFVASER